MAIILAIVAILLISKILSKDKPGAPPPKIVSSTRTTERDWTKDLSDENTKFFEYEEDHFFDIYRQIWVKKIGSGRYVRSVDFYDWKAGKQDEYELVKPAFLVYAEEAKEDYMDPKWLRNMRTKHFAWMNGENVDLNFPEIDYENDDDDQPDEDDDGWDSVWDDDEEENEDDE